MGMSAVAMRHPYYTTAKQDQRAPLPIMSGPSGVPKGRRILEVVK